MAVGNEGYWREAVTAQEMLTCGQAWIVIVQFVHDFIIIA